MAIKNLAWCIVVPSATESSVPRETWPLEENASTAPKEVEKEGVREIGRGRERGCEGGSERDGKRWRKR